MKKHIHCFALAALYSASFYSMADTFGSISYQRISDEQQIGSQVRDFDVQAAVISLGYELSFSPDFKFVPKISYGEGIGDDDLSDVRFGGDLLTSDNVSLDRLYGISASLQYGFSSKAYAFLSAQYSDSSYEVESTGQDISGSGAGAALGVGINAIEDLDVVLAAQTSGDRSSFELGLRYHF
ncbi:hypothetical protein [Salinimonas chungwhensis]|uniref:hypothetical protein n=1 Tax=Salinimonas chungwhensis TaxID=265425 RepID=UPI0003724962|nr:hypothetical protein [Salinimonas chungwhensis]